MSQPAPVILDIRRNYNVVIKHIRNKLVDECKDKVLSAEELAGIVMEVIGNLEGLPQWLRSMFGYFRYLVPIILRQLNIDWSTPLTEEEIDMVYNWILTIIN